MKSVISLAIILGMLVPVYGDASADLSSSATTGGMTATSVNSGLVRVVTAPQVSTVAVTSASQSGLCSISSISGVLDPSASWRIKSGMVEIVQDASALNLNQPGSCFNLNLGRVVVQEHLAVADLVLTSTIVVHKTVRYERYSLTPISSATNPASGLPVAPTLTVLVVGLVLSLRKQFIPIRVTKIIKHSLSLSELQVLRC